MKTHSLLWLFLGALLFNAMFSPTIYGQEPIITKSDIVALCGDSITASGYPIEVETYLIACYNNGPTRGIRYGWPGDSFYTFFERKCGITPVLSAKPTAATILYGMNDGAYQEFTDQRGKSFRAGLTRFVQELKKGGVITIVIVSPTVVDTTSFTPKSGLTAQQYNQTLAKFAAIASEIAKEEGVIFADLHHLMAKVMEKAKAKYGENYFVAGKDGVHPQANGNLIIVYALLKALGCDGDIGSFTIDLSTNKANASAGHRVVSFIDNEITLESSRYPFCFTGDPGSPDATTGIIEFFPFNDDLNRLMLIVKGLKPDTRVKLTWGAHAKEYASAELEKGINLAAEFMDNPFSEPYRKVRWVVMDEKAKWASRAYMKLLSNLPSLMENLKKAPEEAEKLAPADQADLRTIRSVDEQAGESLERLTAAIVKRDSQLFDKACSVFLPVEHKIKIEVLP